MRTFLNGRIRKTNAREPRTFKVVFTAWILLVLAPAAVFAQDCPSDFRLAPASEIGLCEHQLGLADYAAGRIEQAETHYLRALKAWDSAGASYTAQQVATLIALGRLYQATHRPEDAARMLTRALQLARPIESAHPQLVAVALSRLGGLYSVSGTVEQARATLTEAIAKLRKQESPDLPELAYAHHELGMTDLRAGSYAEGESNLRQAVSIATECLGEDNSQTAIYETGLGLALYLESQYSRALPVLRRAAFLLQARPDENTLHLGTALAELSTVEAALGKFALAENDGSRALAVLSRQFSSHTIEIARAQVNLGAIYLAEHKTAEAAEILPGAVATERRILADSPALTNGIRWLARLRAEQRDWNQAECLYREALQMYRTQPDPAHAEMIAVRHEYAEVLKQERRRSTS